MAILHTATFTIAIRGASDDEIEAAAAAFTCALHRAGLAPADALAAWGRMDDWARAEFAPCADPGRAWRRTMAAASEAVAAALRASGLEGQRRPFVIQSGARPR
jgi:hypothetical protein